MASILQQLLGGGVPPESLGRKATSVGDRDVASRDTVYRKPAPTKAAKPTGGGGGGRPSGGGGGGGGGGLPKQAPIPTPNPMSAATTSPSAITPPMGTLSPTSQPGFVPTASPTSVPSDLPVMSSPTSAPGFAPTMSPTSVPGDPRTMSPTSVPGPGRDELAALLKPGLQPQRPGEFPNGKGYEVATPDNFITFDDVLKRIFGR